MKFSLWLEKRNQRSAEKMPERMSSLELHQRAVKKAAVKCNMEELESYSQKPKKAVVGRRTEKQSEILVRFFSCFCFKFFFWIVMI